MLAISLLVLLHEGGHFFFSKLFGVRVEKFYLFFDWKFSLFKFKPKNSDTEYGIGWIPLGGYCKIAGMIDESFDTEQMKQPVQNYEFRAKPSWQRLLIMIGGVLVNFLLALFIYAQILFWWGDTYIPVKDMTLGMKFNQEAKSYGFRDGDILVGTDTKAFKDFSADLYRDISEAHRVDIIRDGKPMSIPRRQDLLATATTAADSLKARTVVIAYGNDAKVDTTEVVLTPELKLGFTIKALADIYKPTTVEYGFLESIPAGIKYGWHVLTSYVDDMKYVFSAEGAKSLGGFGAIGSLFPPMWDWYMFWKMTAFLSIILAFMNILPIPALDGGHVLFLLYEMITRRKPSENFMIKAEYVGFGILILLMVVANLNDILRWLGYM